MKALLLLLALATTARAQGDDPRVLFASGRYAAAAEIFERRWEASGDAVDGVNAVVSWRTAGRYARAAALLARVRDGKAPPSGEAAETAASLRERLGTLTATATIAPVAGATLARDAVIRVDSDPAERLDAAILLDVGEHDIVIEQESCTPFVWHAIAHPGEQLEVPFAPRCDRAGTLHVYLAGDPDESFEVDGKAHRAVGHEAELKLEPGVHALRIASKSRPVLSESVTIKPQETSSLRVRYPWRAQKPGFILAFTSTARAGGVWNGAGFALTLGVDGSRFRITAEAGSQISDVDRLGPGAGGPGRPLLGGTAAYHIFTRPLWTGRLGSHHLALDFDPIAIRYDEVRENSFFGIRATDLEAQCRGWSFLPLSLSADGPYVHVEVALWPISIIHYQSGSIDAANATVFDKREGFGSFLTILAGWRLL